MSVGKRTLIFSFILSLILPPLHGLNYLSAPPKDQFISDAFLRELVRSMNKDLADAADSYIDPMPMNEMPAQLAMMARASKDLENEQLDYDSLLEGNPSPSLRDQV